MENTSGAGCEMSATLSAVSPSLKTLLHAYQHHTLPSVFIPHMCNSPLPEARPAQGPRSATRVSRLVLPPGPGMPVQYIHFAVEIAQVTTPTAFTDSQGPPATVTLVGSATLLPLPVPSCPELPFLQDDGSRR